MMRTISQVGCFLSPFLTRIDSHMLRRSANPPHQFGGAGIKRFLLYRVNIAQE
jgi:hypothetical protein